MPSPNQRIWSKKREFGTIGLISLLFRTLSSCLLLPSRRSDQHSHLLIRRRCSLRLHAQHQPARVRIHRQQCNLQQQQQQLFPVLLGVTWELQFQPHLPAAATPLSPDTHLGFTNLIISTMNTFDDMESDLGKFCFFLLSMHGSALILLSCTWSPDSPR
jgi:hypothetical protein